MSTIAAREAMSSSIEAAKKEDIYTCIPKGINKACRIKIQNSQCEPIANLSI